MRAALVLVCLLLCRVAGAQEWTDTRVGSYDFICESLPAGSTSTVGTFVSGHQRFSLAARSCAAAAKANPALAYQVRPATYKIALVAPSTTPPPPPAQPEFALALDPTCSAVVPLETTVGVAFVAPALRACLSGAEKDTAAVSLVRISGDDLVANGVAVSADGKISVSATRAAAGRLSVRFATVGGVMLDFERNWQVQP